MRHHVNDGPACRIGDRLKYVSSHYETIWLHKYRKPFGYAKYFFIGQEKAPAMQGLYYIIRLLLGLPFLYPVISSIRNINIPVLINRYIRQIIKLQHT